MNWGSRRFVGRVGLIAVLVGLLVAIGVVQSDQARSTDCSGDNWADFGSWTDNYGVGDDCDQRGEYTRGIQMIINGSYPYLCYAGTVDGIWGPDTKDAVECMQESWNLPEDGLVYGGDFQELRLSLVTAGFGQYEGFTYKLFETQIPAYTFWYLQLTGEWYLERDCSSDLERFHRLGPDYQDCLD